MVYALTFSWNTLSSLFHYLTLFSWYLSLFHLKKLLLYIYISLFINTETWKSICNNFEVVLVGEGAGIHKTLMSYLSLWALEVQAYWSFLRVMWNTFSICHTWEWWISNVCLPTPICHCLRTALRGIALVPWHFFVAPCVAWKKAFRWEVSGVHSRMLSAYNDMVNVHGALCVCMCVCCSCVSICCFSIETLANEKYSCYTVLWTYIHFSVALTALVILIDLWNDMVDTQWYLGVSSHQLPIAHCFCETIDITLAPWSSNRWEYL